jgi:hypothetical protein
MMDKISKNQLKKGKAAFNLIPIEVVVSIWV